MAFILTLPGIVWGFLRNLSWQQVLAGAVVVGGWVLLMVGRSQGRKGAEADHREMNAEAAEDMKDIRNEVEGLPDAGRRNAFRRLVRNKPSR